MPVSKKSALLIVQNTSARCPFTLKETGTCAGARLAQFDKRANGQCYTITKYNLGASTMAKSTAGKPTTRQHTQTVRINGARVRLVTKDGRVTQKPALPLEWELQAEMVKALRNMPEYVDEADMVRPGTFTLAGDFNAARRSMREAAKAKATGLTPGEHDMRLYLFPAGTDGGVLALIEVKGSAPVSKVQRKRHALLAALGFTQQAIVRATTREDAAAQAVALVRGWLVANDNNEAASKSKRSA